jgi:hypothetical protein
MGAIAAFDPTCENLQQIEGLLSLQTLRWATAEIRAK